MQTWLQSTRHHWKARTLPVAPGGCWSFNFFLSLGAAVFSPEEKLPHHLHGLSLRFKDELGEKQTSKGEQRDGEETLFSPIAASPSCQSGRAAQVSQPAQLLPR